MSDSPDKTLLFIVRDGKVLLGLKKRGFGHGRWNGFGGGLESGETPLDAAIRETREEAGLSIDEPDATERGWIEFSFLEHPEWDERVHLFSVSRWTGDPVETEEMRPEWWPMDDLDYDAMWIDDRYWLPRFFAGERIEASFVFGGHGQGTWIEKMRFELPEGYAPTLRPQDGRPVSNR